MFEENGRPPADLKRLIGALEPVIMEKAWMADGVMDDAIADETDAGHCAHMIANEAILDALGVEDLPFELSPQIETLVEKRMADLNAGYVRLENIAKLVAAQIIVPRAPAPRADASDAAVRSSVAEVLADDIEAGGVSLNANDLTLVESMVKELLHKEGGRHG